MGEGDKRESDWIENLVKLGTALGLNGMRLRWKLLRWQKSWRDARARTASNIKHAGYQHAICPRCRQVQDRRERRCLNCGAPLGARTFQIASRLGLAAPTAFSVSTFLGMLLAIAYLRLMFSRPGSGYFKVDGDELIYLGAYFLPAIRAGQFWRHGTAVFEHMGIWHLGFNLFALAQIGPAIEDIFGRGRMLFLFIFTGVVGFVACQCMDMAGLSAGASGAIMGLTGAAAGWGQRDGTSVGRNLRNQMLKWAGYTMVFGFLIHANNIAHAGGFVSGALLGFVMPPRWLRKGYLRGSDLALGLLGFAGTVTAFALVMHPPKSSEAWANAYEAERRALFQQATEADDPPEIPPAAPRTDGESPSLR